MKNLFFAAIATSLLLSSCGKTFYQVYNTDAPGMKEEGSSLVYENEDCKLLYNLWSEDGNAGFVMHNKTDKDLFLVLSQTFFIKNGEAFDYYKNREYSKTTMMGYSSGASAAGAISGFANIWGDWYRASKMTTLSAAKTRGYSSTVTTKEIPVVCIPAHSSKYIKEYAIFDKILRDCNKKQAYPRKKSTPITFTKEDSPLVFKNRISYYLNKEVEGLKQVENEFWVSEVINYTEKEALSKKKYSECEGDLAQIMYVFKMASPRKFYNSFRGVSATGSSNKDEVILKKKSDDIYK